VALGQNGEAPLGEAGLLFNKDSLLTKGIVIFRITTGSCEKRMGIVTFSPHPDPLPHRGERIR
jgi:hypothetical protein